MAQTLTKMATALSSPVKVTDSQSLTANMAAIENLSVAELKAISIISLAYELVGYSGTNYYSPSNFKQLHSDAVSLFGGISFAGVAEESKNKTLIQTVLDWNAGITKASTLGTSYGGTSTTSSVNSLLAAFPMLQANPEETLQRMIFTLRYKLSLLSV